MATADDVNVEFLAASEIAADFFSSSISAFAYDWAFDSTYYDYFNFAFKPANTFRCRRLFA